LAGDASALLGAPAAAGLLPAAVDFVAGLFEVFLTGVAFFDGFGTALVFAGGLSVRSTQGPFCLALLLILAVVVVVVGGGVVYDLAAPSDVSLLGVLGGIIGGRFVVVVVAILAFPSVVAKAAPTDVCDGGGDCD
jgi:hypothetical protein